MGMIKLRRSIITFLPGFQMAQFFEVNNLSYAHPVPGGEAHPALTNVSFSIPAGQYTAIVGIKWLG